MPIMEIGHPPNYHALCAAKSLTAHGPHNSAQAPDSKSARYYPLVNSCGSENIPHHRMRKQEKASHPFRSSWRVADGCGAINAENDTIWHAANTRGTWGIAPITAALTRHTHIRGKDLKRGSTGREHKHCEGSFGARGRSQEICELIRQNFAFNTELVK